MSKLDDKTRYIICVIGEFARQFTLSNVQAYRYLREYKGLSFLTRHYQIEHTLSLQDAVEDAAIVCQRNGGALTL